MKRLHVRPELQGKGIIRDLAKAIIREAGKLSRACKCLSAAPFMKEAKALYLSFGFGLKFMEPTLT